MLQASGLFVFPKFGGAIWDANRFNGLSFCVWGRSPLIYFVYCTPGGGTIQPLQALFCRVFGGLRFSVWGRFVLHPFSDTL